MCFHGTYQRHRSGHSLTGNTSPKVSHSCSHSTKQQRNFVAVSSSRVGRCLTCRSASRPGSACSLHSLSEDWCIYSRACCFTERLSERAASLEVYKHNRNRRRGHVFLLRNVDHQTEQRAETLTLTELPSVICCRGD